MAKKQQYAPAADYEKKLERVLERLGVQDYNWNRDRWGGASTRWGRGNAFR